MRQECYYQYMTKGEQPAYRSMLDGFKTIAPELPVLNLDGRELPGLFSRLCLDHPSTFYVEGSNHRYVNNSQYIQLIPQYTFEEKKIKEMRLALESRINRLVQQARDLLPEEEEKYIHDFICINVIYDKLKKQYSHEIIGPLQQEVGVCEGITKTMKVLCGRMGMECIIVISQADPGQETRYRHAQSLVKPKNTRYHLDVAFDNSLGRYGRKRFDYYNLDDKMMFKDHQPLVYGTPACLDGSCFYCKENRLPLTKVKDVSGRMKVVLRKRQLYFAFHWRGGALNREILERIVWTASEAARGKGEYIRLLVSYRQAMMEITVLKGRPQKTICKEEVNEGELDGREK